MTGSELLRLLDRATSHPSWIAFGVFVAVAAWRAVTAPVPPTPEPASDKVRQEVFRAMSAQEPAQRQRAQLNFPGDAWSQDDDFHAMEMQLARRLATQHRISLGDALRGLDDGLRDAARSRSNAQLKNSVPPCRPRPVY